MAIRRVGDKESGFSRSGEFPRVALPHGDEFAAAGDGQIGSERREGLGALVGPFKPKIEDKSAVFD